MKTGKKGKYTSIRALVGEQQVEKFAERLQRLLVDFDPDVGFAWYGTSVGGDVETWSRYLQVVLAEYQKRYRAGFHQMVTVCTLLEQTKAQGVISEGTYDPNNANWALFSCNLSGFCQLGESGHYEYLPIMEVTTPTTIRRALKASAYKKKFHLRVHACLEDDVDRRVAPGFYMLRVPYRLQMD